LDSVSEFVLVKGERSRLLWANRAFREYYGLSNEQLREIIDSDHSDPDDTLQYVRDDHQVYTSGEQLDVTEPVTRHDGEVGYFATIKTPMRAAEGGPIIGTVGTSRPTDDEGKRLVSEDLRGARKDRLSDLRQLIDSLPTCALLVDAKQRVIATTRDFNVEFGISPEPGADYGEVLGDRVPLADALAGAINEARSSDGIARTTESPRRIWEVSVRPWFLPDDRTGGALVQLHDLTKERDAEAALRARNQELRSANEALEAAQQEVHNTLASLAVGAIVVDRDGRVLSANEEALHVLSLEEVGGDLDAWFSGLGLLSASGDALEASDNPVTRALRGELVRDEWLLLRREDLSRERWISVSASPVRGSLRAAAVMTVSDVTQRKQTQRELEEFAYVASHDLQEPLRMVRSFMGLLQEDYADGLDDMGRQYVHYAMDGAERMTVLVRELLEYSRSGAAALTMVDVPLTEVVADVQAELQDVITGSEARVEVESLPVVQADRSHMTQLFRNFFTNALKFRSPQRAPVIRVSSREGPAGWRVEVADNGIGMDPQYAGKVFRMFQRLHSRAEYSGTGIGLAICKRVVERHGGAIGVDAAVGRGCTFWFSLPKES
jgi:signal transduction histidine kinase